MLRRTEQTRRWAAVAATALAAALALSACGGSAGKNKDALGTAVAYSVPDRKAFPEISGTTLDGAKLATADFKGKVLVINIWGSWCGPCQNEAPYLERTYETYKSKGVELVGIDTRENSAQAKAFAKDKQLSYPSLVDGDDEALLAKLVGIVPLQAVPSTVIIDANGKLAWRALRAVDYTELSGALDTVLTGK